MQSCNLSVIFASSLQLPFVAISQCTVNGFRLTANDSVEIGSDYKRFSQGDFMRVKRIVKDLESDEILLEGYQIRRNVHTKGMLPLKLNEVYITIDVVQGDRRAASLQGLQTIPSHIVAKKRRITITNADFPTFSYREHTSFSSDSSNAATVKEGIYNSSELCCRSVLVSYFKDESHRRTGQRVGATLRRVDEVESDAGKGCSDTMRFAGLCGELASSLASKKPYTMADAFAGAGGCSEGAAQAGLNITTAFDFNDEACQTYRLNRTTTDLYHASVDQYLALIDIGFVVDVLHLSPPCQPYSPANNHGGANDERNQATLFGVAELLRKLRPRVATLEETSGIVSHHPQWFHALISLFTANGYSVRWKTMVFSHYGLAQPRKRLVLFAACPGGVLPEFPEPTHGPGLKPYVTIAHALQDITPESTHNNPGRVMQRTLPPYSPHTQLRSCITT